MHGHARIQGGHTAKKMKQGRERERERARLIDTGTGRACTHPVRVNLQQQLLEQVTALEPGEVVALHEHVDLVLGGRERLTVYQADVQVLTPNAQGHIWGRWGEVVFKSISFPRMLSKPMLRKSGGKANATIGRKCSTKCTRAHGQNGPAQKPPAHRS